MKTVYDRHGVQVHHGDCLDVMRSLPDASVHALVTDPPAGIRFMGRAWDSDMGGRHSWVAWLSERMTEAHRVLKPGGYGLVWALPRTSHWTAWALEDAGFEVRDCVVHLFGCLSDDTEILTEHGWRPGIEVPVGEQVAQWDHETGRISLAPVEQVYRAPSDGPMRVLRNADTDQLLTPNHRVYRRRSKVVQRDWVRARVWDDEWTVTEAGDLGIGDPFKLPIGGEHHGPGIGGDDYAALLGWVWTEGGFDLSGTGVRIYQSTVNQDKVDEIAALMDRLGPHKRYDYERTYTRRNGERHDYTAVTWFFSGELAERVRADLPGKRPTYDLLWRMTLAEKRALLNAALLGDGSRQRNRGGDLGGWQFYQQYEDDLIWFQTLLALVGQAGKVGMRTDRPGGAVYVRKNPTTEMQHRRLRNAWEHYAGEVWCVRVPTGAFVARRNGRVFITGNSGFPKSLDVGKAIDKHANAAPLWDAIRAHLREWRDRAGMSNPDLNLALGLATNGAGMARHWTSEVGGQHAIPSKDMWLRLKALLSWPDCDLDEAYGAVKDGAERPVIGTRVLPIRPGFAGETYGQAGSAERTLTTAATDAARQWHGWGTALKPAAEHWWLIRKPMPGTVAATVLEHGTGALNIDGCRAGTSDRLAASTRQHNIRGGRYATESVSSHDVADGFAQHAAGRFPSNIVLTHAARCDDDGCRPDWCPVAELDAQSGTTTSGSRKAGDHGLMGYMGADVAPMPAITGDQGGASRFFPTFRWEPKAPSSERPMVGGKAHETVKPLALMRWMVRLVCTPGGTVLDCFAGSGTTGQAARAEGMRAVLIEQDADHIDKIRARLDARPKTTASEVTAVADEPLDLLDLLDGDAS